MGLKLLQKIKKYLSVLMVLTGSCVQHTSDTSSTIEVPEVNEEIKAPEKTPEKIPRYLIIDKISLDKTWGFADDGQGGIVILPPEICAVHSEGDTIAVIE